jgi:hypothetical protein
MGARQDSLPIIWEGLPMKTFGFFSCIRYLSILLTIFSPNVYPQLDTTGFPMDIGTKFFYQYKTITMAAPIVLVKTIIDSSAGGGRAVRVTILGKDSVTFNTETWTITPDGRFSANGVLLYDARLTADSGWHLEYPSFKEDGTLHLSRTTIFGLNTKKQIRSVSGTANIFYGYWQEQHVALGVGWIYDDNHGYFETGYGQTSELIGIQKNGILYGTTAPTEVKKPLDNSPTELKLDQNFPNPFNPSTTISFTIPSRSFVSISIYDVLGRTVSVLTSEELPAGTYSRQWNASGLPSGVYFYRMQTVSSFETKRMLLTK